MHHAHFNFRNFRTAKQTKSAVFAFHITVLGYEVLSYCVTHSRYDTAFYLALVFLCVGFTYFFLEAEFIGVVQILVYVGAITILFAFSIMLTRRYIMKKEGDE